jgi:predicted MPP superfamily phosphohydrolase
MERHWLTRRTFLVGGSAQAAVAGADGLFLESRDLVVEHIDIQLERLPEEFRGFRIAQISDLHFGPDMGRPGLERAVRLAQSFRPDLLALTGDFVSHPFGRSNGRAGALHAEPYADVLAMVTGIPSVAVVGNHDHWNNARMVDGALTARGITVLRNRAIPLERGRSRIWVSGIDDALAGAADLGNALRPLPSSETTILLAHEPDFADYAAGFAVDLQLSGHSHGGQVRVPGIGALMLPAMAEKCPVGLNRVGASPVYTNRGLGVINADSFPLPFPGYVRHLVPGTTGLTLLSSCLYTQTYS